MAGAFQPADFLGHLASRRWFVLIAVGTAACGAAGWAWTVPPRYQATVQILIQPPASEEVQWPAAMSGSYMESLRTYERLAQGDGLLNDAAAATGVSPSRVRSGVRAGLVGATRILEISAELEDPAKALELARFVAQATIRRGSSEAPGRDQLELVDAGAAPAKPSWPNRPATVIAAMIVALVGALALVLLEFGIKTSRA